MSFGHCGIDWFHSLLNGVSSILILPELSFFRYWKLLQCDNAKSSEQMSLKWLNHFNSRERQSADLKFFDSRNEMRTFSKHLKNQLNINGIRKKAVFYSIHQSFVLTKKIDLKSIDLIVSHEHVSFPFYQIIKQFNDARFIFIVRDPRASIAGYFKGIAKKMGHLPDCHDYFINMSLEEWLNTSDIYYNYKHLIGDKIRIIKNENMINDLEFEMKKFSDWAGIHFSSNLLKRNHFDGTIPTIDSSYLSKSKKPDNAYFSKESIKKRWMNELSDKREILMIETIYNNLMNDLNYPRLTKKSLISHLKGIFYFILPHRGPKRLKFYEPTEDEIGRYKKRLILKKKIIVNFLLKFIPIKVVKKLIILSSIFTRIKIYFFPNKRWSRYDNPLLDNTYRNYA